MKAKKINVFFFGWSTSCSEWWISKIITPVEIITEIIRRNYLCFSRLLLLLFLFSIIFVFCFYIHIFGKQCVSLSGVIVFFRRSSLSFTIAEANAELNCILKLWYYNYTFVSNYWIYCCLYYILIVNKRFQYYKWLIEWENVHFHKFNEHTQNQVRSHEYQENTWNYYP